MLNVVTQVVRLPNCLECPVASVLGNLTITQVASAGGADEASSKKVNINEGDDEDAFEARGATAHFDISWSKRPRPTFAQRRSFTKSRRIGGAQLEPPFSRIPPWGRTTVVVREHFLSCCNTDRGRRSGLDWVRAGLAFYETRAR